jgi:putative oxidoreductase
MSALGKLAGPFTPDIGLLFARITGSLLLLHVHGIPKIMHYQNELAHIDDPLGMGHTLTLLCALFAEVVCPVFIAIGLFTRLAALPVVFLLAVSMVLVHPDWSIEQGQFGWLLVIVFGTIALSGAGRYSVDAKLHQG